MKTWLYAFGILFLADSTAAQSPLRADAGRDTIICVTTTGIQNPYHLGGSPAITGGMPPYKVVWSAQHRYTVESFTASYFLDDTTSADPIFNYGITSMANNDVVSFVLTVTDNLQRTAVDTVKVRFSRFASFETFPIYLRLGDSVRIYANTAGGITPLRYTWTPNYNISDATVRNPMVWPRNTTVYSCKVVDSIGCVSHFVIDWKIFVPNKTDDVNPKIKVNLFPNPVTDKSILAIPADLPMGAILSIFDLSGKLVYTQKINQSAIEIGKELKINGFYLYQIIYENQMVAADKFVVSR